MTSFEELGPTAQLVHLESVAEKALDYWGLGNDCELRLLSLSENATYAVMQPGAPRRVMRVHRTHYHSPAAILSELTWMLALEHDAGIKTPQAIPCKNGDYLACIKTAALNEQRMVALFDWIEGEAPDESHLLAPFQRLGHVTARLHQHAKQWPLPQDFERLRWDFDGCLGEVQHWGDWRAAPGLDQDMMLGLQQAVEILQRRLNSFGTNPERFGLIHADLRLANLLEVDGETRVIDFDDAGFGWYLYDLASALSFIETRPDAPDLVSRWLTGYREIASLSAADEAEIPSFILLRRMTLLAWIGSHPETELAQEQGEIFSQNTVDLASCYVASGGTQIWTG